MNLNSEDRQGPQMSVKTDVLIVGAGPAGASLACFLASHGIKGIIVSRDNTSADTPRAHITNMAAMECLRDIGLEETIIKLATPIEKIKHIRWCHSMAGREYGRVLAFGQSPRRIGDYQSASPCDLCDIPQTLLEPQLVRYATLNGFQIRWDTEFIALEQTQSGVTVELFDKVTKQQYNISASYVFGADGARSRIVEQLGLPLVEKSSGGRALNILVRADLSHLMSNREGDLHWIIQPDREFPDFGAAACVRMVKPWTEWMFAFMPVPGTDFVLRPNNDDYLAQLRNVIGDDTPIEILHVSTWRINEVYATKYSDGRVFCLGDAVHRHPPVNGLGSNTCIQDAYNLAWKIAYVLQNKASPRLLDSYSIERQPVGEGIVKRANEGFRVHGRIFGALGLQLPTLSERNAAFQELRSDTPTGAKRRAALQDAIDSTKHEFHGVGIEMNHDYSASPAIQKDTSSSGSDTPVLASNPDPILFHTRSTKPGWRLPHVWLNIPSLWKAISTIDLAGKGRFTLLTGNGGEVWKKAATAVSASLNVPVHAVSIGWDQDYDDTYADWARIRGVEESGAVLVRPDRFVAWRHNNAEGDEVWAEDKLLVAMKQVLALDK